MLDIRVTFCDKTTEVMVSDHNVLGMIMHLRINHEYNSLLVIFMYRDWISEKTTQNLGLF